MEIVYCRDCGKKLLASDFVRGRAYNIGDQHFCATCRPLPTAPKPAPRPAPPTPRPPAAVRRPVKSGAGLLWGGLAVGAVLVALLAVGLSRRGATAVPDDPGRVLLDQVRTLAAATSDPDAVLARCAQARPRLRGTPHEAGLAAIEAAAREKKLARDADRDFGRLMELIAEVRRNDPEFRRRAELQSLLKKAEDLAGDKRAVVDALRAEYDRAFEEAGDDAAREAREEAERLSRTKPAEALARLDAYPPVFKDTEAAAELRRFREDLSARETPRGTVGSRVEGWTVRGREGSGPIRQFLNRTDVLVTHPFEPGRPATLEKEMKVPAGHPVLRLTVATEPDKDWELRVFVDDQCLFATTVGPGGTDWKSLRAALGDYAGKTVKVRLENADNGGNAESAYWGAVEIVQAAEPEKLQGALRRRAEAWAGWTVTSDPGNGLPVLLGVHQGKPYAYRTHPFSREMPASLERSLAVPPNVKTTFSIAVHHLPNASWEARVRVDGELVHQEIVGKQPRWDRVAVDLTPYAGKTVRLRLENASDDGTSDDGFWAEPLLFTP